MPRPHPLRAIDKVAAMLPTNATEADLAARYVAAGAQADQVMRLMGVHAADIKVFMQLDAQFIALFRASQGALGHLRRMQAVRHKREENNATCDTDAWTQHVVTRSMEQVADAGLAPAAPAAGPLASAAEPLAPAAEEPSALAHAAEPTSAAATTPSLAADSPSPSAAASAQSSTTATASPPSSPSATASPPSPTAAPAAEPPISTPVAACPPASTAHKQAAAPPRSHRMAAPAEADDPPRDLPTEADQYAVIYPRRAREIRHYGGLPSDCSFGPPADDLVRAIATGTSPTLRALDGPNADAG